MKVDKNLAKEESNKTKDLTNNLINKFAVGWTSIKNKGKDII